MPTVRFTYALKRFFPTLREMEIQAATLPELLEVVNDTHPGLKNYVVDERGSLRKHVNIFVNGSLIADRNRLTDPIGEDSEVYIMQALSGG
ncbi:MAG: hypothetical protein Kow0027_14280 [Saprospiraceae bacterium]